MARPRRTPPRWDDPSTDEDLRREIEQFMNEDRIIGPDSGDEAEVARRYAEQYESQRRAIEQLIQDHIVRTDRPIDDDALDALNMIRAAQNRNERLTKTGEPVQDKFINLKELHKMIQGICEFLHIQLIEVPVGSSATRYQAIKKGTSLKDVQRFDRSQDLIFDDEEDTDGTKR